MEKMLITKPLSQKEVKQLLKTSGLSLPAGTEVSPEILMVLSSLKSHDGNERNKHPGKEPRT